VNKLVPYNYRHSRATGVLTLHWDLRKHRIRTRSQESFLRYTSCFLYGT